MRVRYLRIAIALERVATCTAARVSASGSLAACRGGMTSIDARDDGYHAARCMVMSITKRIIAGASAVRRQRREINNIGAVAVAISGGENRLVGESAAQAFNGSQGIRPSPSRRPVARRAVFTPRHLRRSARRAARARRPVVARSRNIAIIIIRSRAGMQLTVKAMRAQH